MPDLNRVWFGDCRDSLRAMAADGIRAQMCVTSPPYWGLRDYGHPGQLGLEPTPQEYVANMVEVFQLVREVLADDGVLWLNLGDSYASQGVLHDGRDDNQSGVGSKRIWRNGTGRADGVVDERGQRNRNGNAVVGLKSKDLCGIPWRVAFALQADGWWLRQDIIWHKPNPMPESVTDRCTKAHEYMFLLAKAERYYYDAAAITEPAAPMAKRFNGGHFGNKDRQDNGRQDQSDLQERNRRSVWTVPTQPYADAHFATFPPALIEPCILAGSQVGDIVLDPFFGSGTTGEVAQRLGRQWIGCEINEAYRPLQDKRVAQQGLELHA